VLESPLDREMVDRAAEEDASERVVRRAWERWVVMRRLWGRFDREGIDQPTDRMEVAADALWPDMPDAHRAGLLAHVRATGRGPVRPDRFEDVVGDALAARLRERGFSDR
jgi:hypothetical protein